ncbi:MAG: nicotinamide mononucleotide transporter [Clostridia bacterium]|nr:nicotinamide mononucleotide transporter [Clostridia bacterium]
MKKIAVLFKSLTKFELKLYLTSLCVVILSFVFSKGQGILSMIASCIGVTALIFIAKGNVTGQILTVVFSIFYGIISFTFYYWGEMITYLGMTAPMAVVAVISWIKNPYEKNKEEVKVHSISKKEVLVMIFYTTAVTTVFYFILKLLKTANLTLSTISVTTSFLASYLTYKRSPFYALAYAANDVVLIGLWVLASLKNISYIPMIMCFVMFLVNDLYGYVCWKKMRERQENNL